MSDNRVLLTCDALNEPLSREIWFGGAPYDLSAGVDGVKLRMRHRDASVLVVDGDAVIVSPANGRVRYDWTVDDANDQGVYRAWWSVELTGGARYDTPEFDVIVDGHSAGNGVEFGQIALEVQRYIPFAWRALSDSEAYDDTLLLGIIEQEKHRLMETPVATSNESTLDFLVLEYLAKRTVLALYPAVLELWANTRITAQTREEQATYPDRLGATDKLHAQMMSDVFKLKPIVESIIGISELNAVGRVGGPRVSTQGLKLLTPGPEDYSPGGQAPPGTTYRRPIGIDPDGVPYMEI